MRKSQKKTLTLSSGFWYSPKWHFRPSPLNYNAPSIAKPITFVLYRSSLYFCVRLCRAFPTFFYRKLAKALLWLIIERHVPTKLKLQQFSFASRPRPLMFRENCTCLSSFLYLFLLKRENNKQQKKKKQCLSA